MVHDLLKAARLHNLARLHDHDVVRHRANDRHIMGDEQIAQASFALQLLQKLQRERGLSYLLITHDVSVIRAMAHHVMVMQAGKVVEAGTFEQVLNNPQAAYTKILVGSEV